MTANLLTQSLLDFNHRIKGILWLLLTMLLFSAAQSQAPANAHRWTQGDGWRFNTTTNKWDAVFHPGNLPAGIIACASSAETETGINAYRGAYNPSLFPINTSLTNCFNQDAPQNTPPRPTNVAGPTSGEDIVWVNFDIRPYAGTYQFQIVSNEDLGWVLYYVDPAYAGPPATNTATGTYPQMATGLSGDITHLIYADCGLSGNGWSTITVPSFAKASNYYLAMWSVEGTSLGSSVNLNFKARYGCGGSSCAFEMDGSPIVSCNSNGTYNVCTNFLGSAGEWTLVDDATTKAVSYEVKTYKLDNTLVNTYTSTNLSTTPIKFVLGTVDLNQAIKVSVCATYADGNNYNLKLLASAKPPGAPNDYVTCTISPVISGNAPLRPTNYTLTGGSYCAGSGGVNVILSSSQVGISYQLQKDNVNDGSPVIGDGTDIDFGLKTAGVYKVIATNTAIPGGCSSVTTPITVTENPSFTIQATPTPVDCFGGTDGSFSIAVTGGTVPFEYSKDGGNNFQPSNTFTGLAANTYSIVVRDANQCQATGSVTITQPAAALNATFTQGNVDCFNGNDGSIDVTVTGGTAPYTYLWSNNEATEDLSGLVAGTYNLIVTDANGCTFPLQVIITQPAAALNATFTQNNVDCFNGNDGSIDVTVTGGTAPYTYLWSNNEATEDLSGLTAGTYTLLITDANGCTFPLQVIITQPAAALNATFTQGNVDCFNGNDGSIDVTVTGGTAPYTYLWSNNEATEDLSGLVAGTYNLIVTDANGCTFPLQVIITQPAAALNATFTQANVDCFNGNDGSIDVTVTGGTAPYIYLWSNNEATEDLSGLVAGTYNLIVTDANGCTFPLQVIITQPAAALNATFTQANVDCFNGNDGSIDVTVTGGTAPYTYLWSNNEATEDLSGLVAGTYNLIVTDANGCTFPLQVIITQPAAALNATFTQGNVDCFNGNDGSIDVTVTGGTAPYTYLWSNNEATEDLSGLVAGTYNLIVTDANGCTFPLQVIITQPAAALNATFTQGNVDCFNGNDGSIDVTVTGGTAPYTYLWSNNEATEDLSGLVAGTYNLIVTDANGCTFPLQVIITQPAAALNATFTQGNVDCFNGNDGSIDVTVTGGTAPYTYLWSNNEATEDLSGLTAGTYTLLITDANGCKYPVEVTITQPAAALNATFTQGNVDCFNGNDGSIDVTVTGGTAPYTYLWSNNEATEDLSGLTAGTYTLLITDANGCTFPLQVIITQPAAALNATFTQGNVDCFNGNDGSIDVTVTGGTAPYTYLWSNNEATEDLSGLVAGTYNLIVTDANGCKYPVEVTITQPAAALNATFTQANVDCFNGNDGSIDVTVTGGTASYTYLWSNNEATEDLSGLVAGTYNLIVTDANGCTFPLQVIITQPAAALNATFTQGNVDCFNGNDGSIDVTVTGGTAPYTYLWSNNEATEDLSGLVAGTYNLIVTDANGCTFPLQVIITQPAAALNATFTQGNVDCFNGNDGSIDVTVTGGTAPYTYLWSNNEATEDLSGLVAGTYNLIVTDANGCTFPLQVIITQPAAALNATFTQANVDCFNGNDGSIDVTVTGGTAPYTYLWSNNEATEDLSGLVAGTYNLIVTDANGCTFPLQVIITQPAAALNATFTQGNVDCFNGNDGSIDVTVTGGTAPYTYLWSNNEATEDLSGLVAGTYNLIVTDANGCTFPLQVIITQPAAALNATFTQANVDCFNGNDGSIDVTVTGGTAPYTYLWSNNEATEDLSGLTAGTYTLLITDANGCAFPLQVIITQPAAALNATFTQANVDCFNGNDGSIDVTVTGGTAPYTYLWSNNEATEDLSGLTAGTYTLLITDANGCTFPLQVIITEPAVLSLSFEAFNVLCNGGTDGSINLTVTGGTGPFKFLWTNGSTSEDLSNIPAGSYNVTVTDANGCIVSLDFPVEISQPAVLIVSATITDVLCFNGSNGKITVLVQGGSEPYTYSINGQTPVSSNVFDGLTAGTYTITVTDANGCSQTIYPKVVQPPVLNLTRTYINPTCYGYKNGSITATFSGGKSPYTLYINGVSKGVQTSPYTFTNLGAGSYTIKVVDKNNCEKSLAVTLSQPQLLTCNIIPAAPMPVCTGNTATLSATATGGTSPYKYSWTVTGGNASIQSGGTTNKVVVNVGSIAGTIEVTLKITDSKNCETTCKKTIIVINCLVNCTYTQGFYGSTSGKACNPTGVDLVAKALIAQSIRNMPGQQLYLGLTGRSFTARVVDSARLNAILPGGGTARILAGVYDLNSSTSYPYPPLSNGKINNVLLSQTIALKLNVYMTPAQIQSLGNMPLQGGYLVTMKKDPASSCLNPKPLNCVVNGTTNTNSIQSFLVPANVVNALSTKTVMGLLEFASRKLGGEALPAGVSLSNINTAVDAINKAFDGCRFILGWSACSQTCSNFGITCPVTYNNFNPSFVSTLTPTDWVKTSHTKDQVITESIVDAFPNPFNDLVKIRINAQENNSVSVSIFNFLGQKIGQPFNGRMSKGETRIIEYRPGQQLSGGIIYQVRIGDKLYTGKLVFDKKGAR